MHSLRNGQCTEDPRLDRVRQVDLRSLDFPATPILQLAGAYEPRSYTWRLETWLDQGSEGACVGFGWAHELAARPGVVSGVSDAFARERVYWEAQRIDEWDGGSYPDASPVYEGTSVLAGAKVVTAAGYIHEYRWALEPLELVLAVGYHGPVVIGVDWYADMMDVDADGFIHANGKIVGGHCVCIPAVRVVRDSTGALDPLKSYFTIHNSWGPSWGVNGRCHIALVDIMKLWPGGDFCIPVGRIKATV